MNFQVFRQHMRVHVRSNMNVTQTPPARMTHTRPPRRGVLTRVRTSPFAADLRANADVLGYAAILLAVAIGGLVLGLTTRDVFIAWDGLHQIGAGQ